MKIFFRGKKMFTANSNCKSALITLRICLQTTFRQVFFHKEHPRLLADIKITLGLSANNISSGFFFTKNNLVRSDIRNTFGNCNFSRIFESDFPLELQLGKSSFLLFLHPNYHKSNIYHWQTLKTR